ncbi:MAG: hypothetical protein KBF93_03850 [Leptospiraceae bacterium]|nr:hypothetical protein [Leptospiraceae bacterium]
MLYYLLFITVFSVTIFLNLGSPYTHITHVRENWAWSKTQEVGMSTDTRFKFSPMEKLNGYKTENGVYFFRAGKFVLDENSFSEMPLNGKGHFLYKKIGNSVLYYSNDGEILWDKPYKSYPRVSHNGELLLFISGDSNQVLVSDLNGNPTGAKQIDGRFLSDISFPVMANGALLVFSGGEIALLDGAGNIIFQKKDEPTSKDFLFCKSGAVSPNGKYSLVHYLRNQKDFVSMLNEKGEILSSFTLDNVYPHKIFMALDDEGNMAINLPDSYLIVNKKGKPIVKKQKSKREDIYQIAYSSGSFFAVSVENQVLFFSNTGNVLGKRNITMPARMRPSGDRDTAFLETKEEIISFRLFQ